MNNLNQNVFNKYSRKGLSELTPFRTFVGDMTSISVSEQDKLLSNEEFEAGYIARNPKNHLDMWYIAKKYFDDNLELFEEKERYGEFLTFGEAIEAVKQGLSIARIGWNGKNMCVYIKKGNDSTSFVNKDGTVEYPSGIRGDLFEVGDTGTIRRLPCLCMKTADGSILEGWLASQSDILAEDWVTILPEIKE